MPFAVKSHPQSIEATRTPSVEFIEWAYEGAAPRTGDEAVWFTAETSGGFGLYALGRFTSDSEPAGKNSKGNPLVRVAAEFHTFEPTDPLGKSAFQALPREGTGSPIQELNRRLYINSHVKIAEIDDGTFQFLVARF